MSEQIMDVSYRRAIDCGVDPQGILNFIQRLEDREIAVHAFIISRHDAIIAEGAFEPYSLDERHMLFSLSKSFTSTAIGFAVQEGLLTVDDKLVDFFPDVLPTRPCPNMEKVTVKHLLTMNTGHSAEPHIFSYEPNWTYSFLASYLPHEPGTHFLYNTPATYMLSSILTKVTGLNCLDYLKPRLFEPLGFNSNPWWEMSPEGVSMGGFGLNISVRDIAKFARFCLHRGTWNGQLLLNEAWFDEATTAWSDNSTHDQGSASDWGQGYGYQFWMCKEKGAYRGDGACGQFAIMHPEKDLYIAITSGTDKMGPILDAVWEEILPALHDEALVETAELLEAEALLSERLASLKLWTPDLPGDEATVASFLDDVAIGSTFDLSHNERRLNRIRFTDDYLELEFQDQDQATRLPLDSVAWTAVNMDVGDLPYTSLGQGLPKKASILVSPRKRVENVALVLDLAFTETVLHERWIIQATRAAVRIEMTRVSAFAPSSEVVHGILLMD